MIFSGLDRVFDVSFRLGKKKPCYFGRHDATTPEPRRRPATTRHQRGSRRISLVSHDGTPFVSVYTRIESEAQPRPSLQIYYTPPDAGDAVILEQVAGSLEADILAFRLDMSEFRHRLDVYGLPLAAAAS